MNLTPIVPNLDPNAIIERGFVSQKETEDHDLSALSGKVNLFDDENDPEGIWAAFVSKEDRALYEGSGTGEEIHAVLLNHALAFYPNPTWGRVIIGKTNGTNRPVFHRKDQVERFKATHEAYCAEFPMTQKPEGEAEPEEDKETT